MKKSLNNKRNEITEEQIRHLTRVFGDYEDGEMAEMAINGETETRVISRIFEDREFGFLKVTVERPLRMNFEATPERIARLDNQTAFTSLATSKKRRDEAAAKREIEEGRKQQDAIRAVLAALEGKGSYRDRAVFEADMMKAAKRTGHKIPATIKKAIFAALGERDQDAEICRDNKGRPEPDSELRDTENIPLPSETTMPLPMEFGPNKPNSRLVETFRNDIDAYIAGEVLPHVPDAWVDYDKTKVGYEIPINRHFYVYKPPRPLGQIEADITALEGEIAELLPPLDTQRRIAWFLDEKTGRIDGLIAKKRELLDRLAEKRQALITRAVTKGLNARTPMKPSGIEWLGDIPTRWEVLRLKFVASEPLSYGANAAAEFDEPEWPRFVRITDVDELGRLRDETFCSLPPEVALGFLLQANDILLARSGATVGKSFIYRVSWGVACYAGYLIRVRVEKWHDARYLYWFLNSTSYWEWVRSTFIQSTIQNISADRYANLPIPTPSGSEQSEIVDFIENSCAEIDCQQDLISKSIERLDE